jgi:hypothetical protein
MKTPFNNNLPPKTSDVIVNPINPENPDSKTNGCCAHNFHRRLGEFLVFVDVSYK